MNTSSPQKKVNQKVAAKSEAILAGAMQEFTAHGFTAASMDRVAIAAGVSKPTLYSYFQDKEGLFTALIHQLLPKDFLSILQDPISLQVPPQIFLRQLATGILSKFSGEQPLLTFIRLTLGESERFPDLAQSFVKTIQKPMIEQLTKYFENQQILRYSDPEIVARMFVGTLMHYVITHEILHGQDILPIEQSRLINGLVDLLLMSSSI